MNLHPSISVGGDVVSLGLIVGAFMQALPALAGLAGLIWYGIQIYESKTVQRHVRAARIRAIRKRRAKAATRKPTA